MRKLLVDGSVLRQTLAYLQASGQRGHEGVVLWLGAKTTPVAKVVQAYEPLHNSAEDFFHIPPEGMDRLLGLLGKEGWSVLAQVHTHPGEAFHSRADDKWALVRHLNALSLVLPYFARATTVANFLVQAATYRLTLDNKWVEVQPQELPSYLEVTP